MRNGDIVYLSEYMQYFRISLQKATAQTPKGLTVLCAGARVLFCHFRIGAPEIKETYNPALEQGPRQAGKKGVLLEG